MRGKKAYISKNTWTLLYIVWIAKLLTTILGFSYGMMLPDIMSEFQLDFATSGQIMSIAGIVSVFTTIPSGIIITKYNPKYSIPAIILITVAGQLCFGMAMNIPMLFIGKILVSVVGNTLFTALVLVKFSKVPQSRLSQVNGIEIFVNPIGQTIATLFMAQILTLVAGWRNVYKIIIVLQLILVGLWLFLYRDDSNPAKNAGKPAAAKDESEPKHPFRIAIKQKTFWLTALSWPWTTLIWTAMFYFWPSYAMEAHGITRATAGMVLGFLPIFSAIGSLSAPKIAEKLGRDKILIWPWGFILPVAYLGMMLSGNIAVLCIFSAIAGFGALFFVPIGLTTLYKLGLHPKVVSIGTAMTWTSVSLGAAMGSGIVGVMIQYLGPKKGLLIACFSPIILGVLSLFLPERGRLAMEKEAREKARQSEIQMK